MTLGIFLGPLIAIPIPLKPDCENLTKEACDTATKHWGDNWYVNYYWHIMFALPIVCAVLQMLLFSTCFKYETPIFLAEKGRNEELREVLSKIYQDEDSINKIERELKKTAGDKSK